MFLIIVLELGCPLLFILVHACVIGHGALSPNFNSAREIVNIVVARVYIHEAFQPLMPSDTGESLYYLLIPIEEAAHQRFRSIAPDGRGRDFMTTGSGAPHVV